MDKTSIQPRAQWSIGNVLRNFLGLDLDEESHQGQNRSMDDLPPPYEEVVPSSRHVHKSQRPKEAATVLSTDKMDPLVASAYKNKTLSPLVRLPDALIVSIMERLDFNDIRRLRHVSRDFMRLFSQSKAFQKYHVTDAHNRDGRTRLARVWATPGHYPKQHLGSIRAPDLCNSCTTFRKRKGYGSDRELFEAVPFIYCAGCKMEHRAFYFSARQRHESNDEERLCKGLEGYISLCEHISVNWDSAQRLADAPPGENMIQCDNGHHKVSPCRHVRKGTSELCCDDDKPRFKFFKDEKQNLCFDMSITTHLPFKSQGLEHGDKVSSRALRRSITELVHNRLQSPSYRWVPARHHSLDGNLRAFDPNICSCLDWGQPISRLGSSAQRKTTAAEFEWKLCPNPSRPWRLRTDLGSLTPTGRSEFRREHQDRCAGFTHDFHFDYLGGSEHWDYKRCPEDQSFLVLTLRKLGCVSSPHDCWWSCHINPESCDLERDDEMRSILWCPNSGCRFKNSQIFRGTFFHGKNKVAHHRSRQV